MGHSADGSPRTDMHVVRIAAPIVLIFAFAACGAATDRPSPSPSPTAAPATPAPSPSDAPAPSDPPTPTPTAEPTASPAPTDIAVTPEEQALLDGVRRDVGMCVPVRADLPPNAIAGIECRTDDAAIDRIGFYRFADDDRMLDAYLDRMASEGVGLESGSCRTGAGEGAYWPGEGMVAARNGCFVNAEGFANYRATLPGERVYIGILGSTADAAALEDFAWIGSQDTPGSPTLWAASR